MPAHLWEMWAGHCGAVGRLHRRPAARALRPGSLRGPEPKLHAERLPLHSRGVRAAHVAVLRENLQVLLTGLGLFPSGLCRSVTR